MACEPVAVLAAVVSSYCSSSSRLMEQTAIKVMRQMMDWPHEEGVE